MGGAALATRAGVGAPFLQLENHYEFTVEQRWCLPQLSPPPSQPWCCWEMTGGGSEPPAPTLTLAYFQNLVAGGLGDWKQVAWL